MQNYIIFCGLKFKLEIMNIMLQMTNIITKCYREKGKSSQSFLAEKFLAMYQHSIMGLAMKVNSK